MVGRLGILVGVVVGGGDGRGVVGDSDSEGVGTSVGRLVGERVGCVFTGITSQTFRPLASARQTPPAQHSLDEVHPAQRAVHDRRVLGSMKNPLQEPQFWAFCCTICRPHK